MTGEPTMTQTSINPDPRDDVLGRSRVVDNPALEAFYEELPGHNAAAFWKRANSIEPWEPESRYNPTVWRYDEMRDLCLRAIDLVKPEEAGRRVVVLLNDSDAGRQNSEKWSVVAKVHEVFAARAEHERARRAAEREAIKAAAEKVRARRASGAAT